MKISGLFVGLFVVALAITKLYAITVNPASNVTADSANTAETVVLRDTSGNFSAGTITATSIVNTGLTGLAVQTTTQLQLRSDAVGSVYLAQERVAGVLVSNTYNLCASTAANVASYVYISVSTSAPAALGAACSN